VTYPCKSNCEGTTHWYTNHCKVPGSMAYGIDMEQRTKWRRMSE